MYTSAHRWALALLAVLAAALAAIAAGQQAALFATPASQQFDDGSGEATYAPNTHKSWLITAPEAQVVALRFTSFDTRWGDYVRAYDGSSTSAPRLSELSGWLYPPILVASTGRTMLVTFDSDDSSSYGGRGFAANYTAGTPGTVSRSILEVVLFPCKHSL
eukprot:tig00000042_g15584.t1